jgi:hypothetical protein
MYEYDIASSGGLIIISQKNTSWFGILYNLNLPVEKIKYDDIASIKPYLIGGHVLLCDETSAKTGLHSFIKDILDIGFIGDFTIKVNTPITSILTKSIKMQRSIRNTLNSESICAAPDNNYFVYTQNNNFDELAQDVFKYYSDGELIKRYTVNEKNIGRLNVYEL